MIYISAQPDDVYFVWQLIVCLKNFAANGIKASDIHILIGYVPEKGVKSDCRQMIQDYQHLACFYTYPDYRLHKEYRPSIRPHILRQHFHLYAGELEKTAIFYFDSDIVFTDKLPELDRMEMGEEWYVSDTRNYLDSNYVRRFGEKVLDDMCAIVGISKEMAVSNDAHVGGAQYIMKGVTAAFWEKIERDCELLYRQLKGNTIAYAQAWAIETGKPISAYHPIQAWCADMWAILWNAFVQKRTILIEEQLAFCWPAEKLSSWDEKYIFHNAGVDADKAVNFFHKGSYFNTTPFFNSFDTISREHCSYAYSRCIKETTDTYFKVLKDTTFLLMVTNQQQMTASHLTAVVKYLQQYFDAAVLVIESATSPVYGALCEDLGVSYLGGCGNSMEMLNKQLLSVAATPVLFKYDLNYLLAPDIIYQAVVKIRCQDAAIVAVAGHEDCQSSDFLSEYFFAANDAMPLLGYNARKASISTFAYRGSGIAFNTAVMKQAGSIYSAELVGTTYADSEMLTRLENSGVSVDVIPAGIFNLRGRYSENGEIFDEKGAIAYIESSLLQV